MNLRHSPFNPILGEFSKAEPISHPIAIRSWCNITGRKGWWSKPVVGKHSVVGEIYITIRIEITTHSCPGPVLGKNSKVLKGKQTKVEVGHSCYRGGCVVDGHFISGCGIKSG